MSDTDRWRMLQSRVLEQRLIEAFAFLRAHQIEPIVIKGWAAARYYPQPWERFYSDIDLMVAAADYEKSRRILENYPQPIDLHREAKLLDTVPFADIYAAGESLTCGETMIRVPCREDHLRILCVHWLIDGGARKDKLRDIYFAVRDRPADFDWERCLGKVSRTRQKWIKCVIGLTEKHLNLSIEDLPFAAECRQIPAWVNQSLEKEWSSQTPLIPLEQVYLQGSELWRQLKKRFPPNALSATVDMEGEFDDRPRLPLQIGDMFYRLALSLKRLWSAKI